MWYEWWTTQSPNILDDFESEEEMGNHLKQFLIDFGEDVLENTFVTQNDGTKSSIYISEDKLIDWVKQKI